MTLSQLRNQGIADLATGTWPEVTLDAPISVRAMCVSIRFQKLEREDIVKLLDALAGSIVTTWPRTAKGFTTPEAQDILEWLDNASDSVADGIGLSDWVAK